ncbi:MAG: helix-turn-helix domain-containing protein [Maioricimonas sp. JB049]
MTVSGETISLLDLPSEVRTAQPRQAGLRAAATPSEPAPLTAHQEQERQRIIAALTKTGGNRTEAARLLKTSRVTLWKKIRKYAIEG